MDSSKKQLYPQATCYVHGFRRGRICAETLNFGVCKRTQNTTATQSWRPNDPDRAMKIENLWQQRKLAIEYFWLHMQRCGSRKLSFLVSREYCRRQFESLATLQLESIPTQTFATFLFHNQLFWLPIPARGFGQKVVQWSKNGSFQLNRRISLKKSIRRRLSSTQPICGEKSHTVTNSNTDSFTELHKIPRHSRTSRFPFAISLSAWTKDGQENIRSSSLSSKWKRSGKHQVKSLGETKLSGNFQNFDWSLSKQIKVLVSLMKMQWHSVNTCLSQKAAHARRKRKSAVFCTKSSLSPCHEQEASAP